MTGTSSLETAAPPKTATEHKAAKPAPRTIVFFDFARGISAQAVVLGHALNIFVPGIFMVPGQRVFYIQSFAVVIFFVLSGYLITSAVLKKRSHAGFTFGNYLMDRVARVVYPLLPAVALIVAFDFLVFQGSRRLPFINIDLSPQAIAGSFTMLFNHPVLQEVAVRTSTTWIDVGPVGTGAPLWSVTAEWWIYVAFGILALTVLSGKRMGILRVALLLFAIAVPVGYMAHGSYESLAWIIGMLYAIAAPTLRRIRVSAHLWLFGLASAVFAAGIHYTGQNLHAAVTVAASAVAFCHLFFALEGRAARTADAGNVPAQGGLRASAGKWFVSGSIFLSSFSYSLYLVHFSVITYIWFHLHSVLSAWQLILLSLILCNLLAYAYYLLVERHFHKVGKWLKRHFLPRSKDAAPLQK
ncbi:peptidoglycan/LPS O-acetylase OafA/YrhL [Arthrobacter pascens]|uniref:acyltransferase family protein n=1 Tax=Arthrobacter pascens TaxID=1677 RepID=UPI00285D3EDE|nr:acyltransferase [Arthrobacter pascens]MDR6556252.1 peptidoglycan/LPS O-acetylase OafA/YrhL [Arthrobacter pascens]